MSLLAGIAAAAGSALSGLASAGANIWSTVYQNKANRAEASANRGFQKDMSDTAHQREVADLKAAGLNPLLSAGGSGSSTPSGSVAHIESPVKLDPMMILDIQKARADISRTRADEAVARATEQNILEQNKNIQANNQLLGLDARIRNANLYKMEQDARIENTWYGRNILAPIRSTLGAVGSIFGRVPEYMPKTVKGR